MINNDHHFFKVFIIADYSENSFEQKILDYLNYNPSGSTITDIANGIDASRNTIKKYIKILEKADKVYRRKIGNYNLCFSAEKLSHLDKFLKLYKGLLYGLKKEFPNQEQKFKEVGRHIADYYTLPMGHILDVLKDLDFSKSGVSLNVLTETFENIVPYKEVFQDPIQLVGINLKPEANKIFLKYSNSTFLEKNDDFIYHLYINFGYLEALYEKLLGKSLTFTIEKITLAKDDKPSIIEISISSI
ncbi:MAG: winged helix-turn-helix transcriptional regulator [Promethearchaeia archaeon]